MTFERSNIQAMTGYSSGEQPDSKATIKLNTNENPFPPGPAVAKALASINVENLRAYPPPTASKLQASIAEHHQLQPENVLVTNGGDELLRLVLATFVETSESIAIAEPSYSLYNVLAAAHGCSLLSFALTEDWQLPDNYARQLNQAGAKMCFVVNPNAPSGHLLPVSVLRQLASEYNGLLLIDEAYVDFVDPALKYDCVALIKEFENILILRTFSKGYSLAGLRMAYGLGSASLIDPMQYKTKDSYNTDFIAQHLAQAALEDQPYAAKSWIFVREQRSQLSAELAKLGFSSLPSQSNFILVTVPDDLSAESVYQRLKRLDILVRYFNLSGLKNKLRITIGTVEENNALVRAIKTMLRTLSS